MDSLCAELVGFDAQEILQREADQAAAKAARSAEKAAAKEEAAGRQATAFGKGGLRSSEASDPRLLTALLGSEHLLNHACTAAFRRFDANGDGVLQVEEVQDLVAHLCSRTGVATPRAEMVERLFQMHDRSRDGLLQADEFATFYRALLASCAKEQKKLNPW